MNKSPINRGAPPKIKGTLSTLIFDESKDGKPFDFSHRDLTDLNALLDIKKGPRKNEEAKEAEVDKPKEVKPTARMSIGSWGAL